MDVLLTIVVQKRRVILQAMIKTMIQIQNVQRIQKNALQNELIKSEILCYSIQCKFDLSGRKCFWNPTYQIWVDLNCENIEQTSLSTLTLKVLVFCLENHAIHIKQKNNAKNFKWRSMFLEYECCRQTYLLRQILRQRSNYYKNSQ